MKSGEMVAWRFNIPGALQGEEGERLRHWTSLWTTALIAPLVRWPMSTPPESQHVHTRAFL